MRGEESSSISQTFTEDEQSEKRSLFSQLFGGISRGPTTTYEDDSIAYGSTGSVSTDNEGYRYQYHGSPRTDLSESFETDTEDENSVDEFEHSLRVRHMKACKSMRRSTFSQEGNFPKTLKEFEWILTSLLERHGKTHSRVAGALHNIGIANLRAGKFIEAMDAMKEAIRIRKVTLGNEDSKIADSLVELGIILLSMKEYSDSIEVLYEALELRERDVQAWVLPADISDNNLKLAKVLNNIGCVHYERSDNEEAKKAYEMAIVLQKKALGKSFFFDNIDPASKPGYLTMASTLCNKGYVDLEQSCYAEAVATFQESLKLQKALLGVDDDLVLSTLDNLGYAHSMCENYERALETYEQLHANKQQSYRSNGKDQASTLRKIIFTKVKLQKYDSALESLCSLEDLQLEVYGEESKQVVQTRRLMGEVNYQVLKFPSLARFWGCGSTQDAEDINVFHWRQKKPSNGSKMSGHRVTFA